jgi:hypothetical protein
VIPLIVVFAFIALLAVFFWLLVKHIGGADIGFWDAFGVMLVARMASNLVKSATASFGSLESIAISMIFYVFGVALYLSYRHGVPVWRGVAIAIIFSIATIVGGVLMLTSGVLPSSSKSSPAPAASP